MEFYMNNILFGQVFGVASVYLISLYVYLKLK